MRIECGELVLKFQLPDSWVLASFINFKSKLTAVSWNYFFKIFNLCNQNKIFASHA